VLIEVDEVVLVVVVVDEVVVDNITKTLPPRARKSEIKDIRSSTKDTSTRSNDALPKEIALNTTDTRTPLPEATEVSVSAPARPTSPTPRAYERLDGMVKTVPEPERKGPT
jgi:hypothetical protein